MAEETSGVKKLLESKMSEANAKIDDLNGMVDKNERKLDQFIIEVEKKIEIAHQKSSQLTEPVQSLSTGSDVWQGPSSYASVAAGKSLSLAGAGQPRSKEDSYWLCRRSLRLMPLGEGDAKEEVRNFISDLLKQDDLFVSSLGDFSVRRIPFGPRSKNRNEAVVVFYLKDKLNYLRSLPS